MQTWSAIRKFHFFFKFFQNFVQGWRLVSQVKLMDQPLITPRSKSSSFPNFSLDSFAFLHFIFLLSEFALLNLWRVRNGTPVASAAFCMTAFGLNFCFPWRSFSSSKYLITLKMIFFSRTILGIPRTGDPRASELALLAMMLWST